MATSSAKDNRSKPEPCFEEIIKDLVKAFDTFAKELTSSEEQIKEKNNYLKKLEKEYNEVQKTCYIDIAATLLELLEIEDSPKTDIRKKYEELEKSIDTAEEVEEAILERIFALEPLVIKSTEARRELQAVSVQRYTELKNKLSETGWPQIPADWKKKVNKGEQKKS